jgi:hypothetical protein
MFESCRLCRKARSRRLDGRVIQCGGITERQAAFTAEVNADNCSTSAARGPGDRRGPAA